MFFIYFVDNEGSLSAKVYNLSPLVLPLKEIFIKMFILYLTSRIPDFLDKIRSVGVFEGEDVPCDFNQERIKLTLIPLF